MNRADTVFRDLPSTCFEGDGPSIAEFAYTYADSPDHELGVVGAATADGVLITHHVRSGNTADKAPTLEHVLVDLNDRFDTDEAKFIADRGLNSQHNLDVLEAED